MTKPTKSTTPVDETTPAPARPPRARKTTAAKKRGAAPATPAPSPVELAAALNADRAPEPRGAAPAPGPSEPAAPPAAPPSAGPPASVGPVLAGSVEEALPLDATFAERVRARAGAVDVLVFRVGTELFAAALTAIEEALELPKLSHLPEMPPSMLGVISLRGRMLPAYSPARPLGVALARVDAAALIVRAGDRRVALAVDDVDDVMTVELGALRPAPILAGEERDAVLLGVANRGADLVAVLDADALVTACLSDQQALEIA